MGIERVIRPASERDAVRRWRGRPEARPVHFLSRVRDLFFIGFHETLAGDFEILKSRLGLPGRLAPPDDAVEAHVTPPGLDRRLRAGAVENLRKWYKEDYRFLDLCRNRWIRAKKRRLREHLLGWG